MMFVRWMGAVGGLLFLLSGTPGAAQSSADTFFHDAAQQYVAGEVASARRTVERGLEVAPSDPRLLSLQETLWQQDEQSGGGSSSQEGAQDQQQDDPSDGEGGEEQSEASDQETQSSTEDPSGQEASRRPDADPSSTSPGERDPQGRTSAQPQDDDRRPANALSRAQAARLLQALENQEEKLLREVQSRGREEESVENDW